MTDTLSIDRLSAGLDSVRELRVKKGPACSAGTALARVAEQNPTVGAQLAEALDDRDVYLLGLSQVLRDAGVEVSTSTLRRHRRRVDGDGCACPR